MPFLPEVYPELYYEKLYNRIPDGMNPSGVLDVESLVLGKPCWKPSSISGSLEQRTLVLADWTMRRWSVEKMTKVKTLLSQLLDEGFSVYFLPKVGSLTLLSQKQLLDLATNDQIRDLASFSPQSIASRATQFLKLEVKSIYVLDDHWLRCQLQREDDPLHERIFIVSDVFNNVQQLRRDLLGIQFALRRSNPPLSRIILDVFQRELIPSLKEYFPSITISPQYKKVTFKETEADDLATSGHITIGDFSLTLAELRSVEDLDLSLCKDITSAHLESLLAAAPHLKRLNLSHWEHLTSAVTLSPGSLPELIDLDLSFSLIDGPQLLRLLRAAPNLQRLNLADCFFFLYLDEIFCEPFISLPHLEYLNLGTLWASSSSLVQFLEAAPNLKTLEFNTMMGELFEPFPSVMPGCSKLEVIHYDVSNTSPENLQKLLTSTPRLKTLRLNHYDFSKKDSFFMEARSLLALESLVLELADNAPADHLSMLIAASPMLKTLKLEGAFDLSGRLYISSGTLSVLEELHCDFISIANLKKLLAAAPGIKTLHIKSFVETKMDAELIKLLAGKQLYIPWSYYPEPSYLSYVVEEDEEVDSLAYRELEDFTPEYVTCPDPVPTKSYYLGDNLTSFLDSLSSSTDSYILHGTPYVILIQRQPEGDVWKFETSNENDEEPMGEVPRAELENTIHRTIGKFVAVFSTDSILMAGILNPASFIADGGLIGLASYANKDAIVSQLGRIDSYSQSALEGLFKRCRKKIPAWAHCMMQTELFPFLLTLLQQYYRKNPGECLTKLQRSMNSLSMENKQWCIYNITTWWTRVTSGTNSKEVRELLTALIKLLRTTPTLPLHFEHNLRLLRSQVKASKTATEIIEQIESGEVKKLLIDMSEELCSPDLFEYQLQQYAKGKGHQVFCIQSTEDLLSKTTYIERLADGIGVLHERAVNTLQEFISAYRAGMSPILMVNFMRFTSKELADFKAFLSGNPYADGIVLPVDAMIVGVIDIYKMNCPKQLNFKALFDSTERCYWTGAPFPLGLEIKDKKETSLAATSIINLFHAPDWKERLLGRWGLSDGTLIFQEGELAKAIDTGGVIEIQNGLWGEKEFDNFWKVSSLNKAIINGQIKAPVSGNIKVVRSQGYDWTALKPHMDLQKRLIADRTLKYVLNSTTIGDFFQCYESSADGVLQTLPGLIEELAGTHLSVNVTSTLSIHEWAMLASACKKHHVVLVANCVTGVDIPMELAPVSNYVTYITGELPEVIITNIIDSAVEYIKGPNPAWIVIDVSECQPSDLFGRIKMEIKEAPLHFSCSEDPPLLEKALSEGKSIILKGCFSKELVDELASCLLSRSLTMEPPGFLAIVSEKTKLFDFIRQQSHVVPMAERVASVPIAIPTIPLNVTSSSVDAASFNKARQDAVNEVLAHAPSVFLLGPSGAGKATFVHKDLCAAEDKLYEGEAQLLAWIKDATPSGRKILFLENVHLSKKKWTVFEGLFNTPPTILLDGALHSLTPEHKVVFAGQPISYDEDCFFQRRGKIVNFTPLSHAVIYESCFKDVFDDPMLAEQRISAHILKIYDYLCACSPTEVLISPRELQSIALVLRAYYHRYPVGPLTATKHIAYELTAHLVPSDKRDEFDLLFNDPDCTPPLDEVVPSRQTVWRHIDYYLALREMRRTGGNDMQLYGGISGLVFEGEEGSRDHDLIKNMLIARGYVEIHDERSTVGYDKQFYCMPVDCLLSVKETLLRKAFDEGAVVVVDEADDLARMDYLLNDLLKGQTPEKLRPTHPGFTLIAKQNPAIINGQRINNTALPTIKLAPYTDEELYAMLAVMDVPSMEVRPMVEGFRSAQRYCYDDPPTFKILVEFAEKVKESYKLDPSLIPHLGSKSIVWPGQAANSQLARYRSTLFGPAGATAVVTSAIGLTHGH